MTKYRQRQEFPDDYTFFQVYAGKWMKLKEGLEELLAGHHNSECREMLKRYEVNPRNFEPEPSKEERKRSRGLKCKLNH